MEKKKGFVKCLHCNGKSYISVNNEYIKMCTYCLGYGEIYWLNNLIKKEFNYNYVTRFLVRNYSNEDIIVNLTKPNVIIQKNSFIIYTTPLLSRILECKGVNMLDESTFLNNISKHLKLFEYIDYPNNLKYVKFLRRVCTEGMEII